MPSALADPVYRAFVQRIIALRYSSGLTQRDLAAKLGRHQSYVNKTERCERRMDPAEFRAIILALGFDPASEFAAVIAELDEDGEG